jgi:hypothetical protein
MAEPSTTQAAPFSLTRVVGWLAVVATTLGSTACGHGGWPAAPAQKPLNATVPTGASADARVTTNAAEESVPQSELSRATNSFLKHLFERDMDALRTEVAFPLGLHSNGPRALCTAARSQAELEAWVDCLLRLLPTGDDQRDLQTLTTRVYAINDEPSPSRLCYELPARGDRFFSAGTYFHNSGSSSLTLAFRRERPFVVTDVTLSGTVFL